MGERGGSFAAHVVVLCRRQRHSINQSSQLPEFISCLGGASFDLASRGLILFGFVCMGATKMI